MINTPPFHNLMSEYKPLSLTGWNESDAKKGFVEHRNPHSFYVWTTTEFSSRPVEFGLQTVNVCQKKLIQNLSKLYEEVLESFLDETDVDSFFIKILVTFLNLSTRTSRP